ncbi:hypothetical protein [Nocardioides convexus]|uniref:hypothetical protein n=1 Tax=Nocardioides convexus TaxID=2712224 RepID=UPI002418AC21|nr:hypothetical protein [Nocardioides convexus]
MPTGTTTEAQATGLVAMPVDHIHPSPNNPREQTRRHRRPRELHPRERPHPAPRRAAHPRPARRTDRGRPPPVRRDQAPRLDQSPGHRAPRHAPRRGAYSPCSSRTASALPSTRSRKHARSTASSPPASPTPTSPARSAAPSPPSGAACRLLDLPEDEQEEVRAGHSTISHALGQVRAARAAARRARNPVARPIGRPKGAKTTPYFSKAHPLAKAVRAACDHRGRPKVGEVGCGPCWESAIRDDDRTNRASTEQAGA